jgi:hypothetical protein
VIKRTLLGLVAFFLAACGKLPPYAPEQGLRGGYSEMQLSPDIYEVRIRQGFGEPCARYSGVWTELEELALLRSAELTLEKGYHQFIVERGTSRRNDLRTGWAGSCAAIVAYTIKILSKDATITDPSVIIYSAVEIQRELRSKHGLEPIPNPPEY